MRTQKTKIAFIYDFDGTLSPNNMQEYDFIPRLGIRAAQFWQEVKSEAKKQQADEVIMYMWQMLQAARTNKVPILRHNLRDYGKEITFYNGVETWFERINAFVTSNNLSPEHYIISSGIKEMIQGTTIVKNFKKIFASSYIYDQNDVAISPGLAINYTTKTQFLFRINKGALDITDNKTVNKYVPDAERPIPFSQMVFFGDGDTDIPCMKLVKAQGGHSIAVYKPNSPRKQKASELRAAERVDYVAAADYSEGKALETIVRAIITKVAADVALRKLSPAS